MRVNKKRLLLSWVLLMMFFVNTVSPAAMAFAEEFDISVTQTQQTQTEETTNTLQDPDASPSGEALGDIGDPAAPPAEESIDEQGVPTADAPAAEPRAGGKDVTTLLKNLVISITQDGKPVSGGAAIIAGEDFKVEASFDVPVEGDGISDPSKYVSYGDFAILALDSSITVPSAVLDLMFEGDKVGTLTFEDSSSQVRIEFNGEILKDDSIANVSCEFDATMKYTGGDVTEGNPQKIVWILGKQFTVKAKEIPIIQTQVKSGTLSADKTEVNWTVKVNATKNGIPVSLKDYVFKDDLKDVGEYVPTSFKIGSSPATPIIEGTEISYTFGEVTGEQIIAFSTKVPADKLITGGTVSNTAQFGKETLVNTNTMSIPIAKKTLIVKTGTPADGLDGSGKYDPTNRTITWTITVNQDKIPLKDLIITDKLPTNPAGLTWKSAKWSMNYQRTHGLR